jgi:hypothetical protein
VLREVRVRKGRWIVEKFDSSSQEVPEGFGGDVLNPLS